MCDACPDVPADANVPHEHHADTAYPNMSNTYVLWFNDFVPDRRGVIGGKNASLCEMIGAGLRVPPGFSVTTDAFDTMRADTGLRRRVNDLIATADFNDPAGLRGIAAEVRSLIEAAPIDPEVDASVRAAYRELCSRCSTEDIPVAVRSSATAEDLPDASFAGQQDTFLWVKGEDDVIDAMRRCWSSLFTDRAMAYRHETGYDHDLIAMSVGVQQMVEPLAAGVAFTLNPSDGDRSQVAIDSSYGFGEAVVSGEVTPDNFLVDKVILEVHGRTISPKHTELVLKDDRQGVEWRDVDADRQSQPSVTDTQLVEIARLAKAAERHYGSPQDVEWAVDRHLPEGENIVLLQSRPETVWSRKERRTVARPGGGFMDGIVSTLLSPVHTQEKAATVSDSDRADGADPEGTDE